METQYSVSVSFTCTLVELT